jgi:hypothetical protein
MAWQNTSVLIQPGARLAFNTTSIQKTMLLVSILELVLVLTMLAYAPIASRGSGNTMHLTLDRSFVTILRIAARSVVDRIMKIAHAAIPTEFVEIITTSDISLQSQVTQEPRPVAGFKASQFAQVHHHGQ